MDKNVHEEKRVFLMENIDQYDRLIIKNGTGEILGGLKPEDRVLKKEILDRLHEQPIDKKTMAFSNGAWGKIYEPAMNKLARLDLTAAEYKTVLLFLPLIKYSSGLIAHSNYKPVDTGWVGEQLELSSKTAARTIKRLLDYRIISKSYSGKESAYFFNPYIFMRGARINKTLYEMFRKSQWAKEQR